MGWGSKGRSLEPRFQHFKGPNSAHLKTSDHGQITAIWAVKQCGCTLYVIRIYMWKQWDRRDKSGKRPANWKLKKIPEFQDLWDLIRKGGNLHPCLFFLHICFWSTSTWAPPLRSRGRPCISSTRHPVGLTPLHFYCLLLYLFIWILKRKTKKETRWDHVSCSFSDPAPRGKRIAVQFIQRLRHGPWAQHLTSDPRKT